MIKVAVNPTEIFARNLTSLRKMQGKSQADLAKEAKITRQTLMKYERGETDPSISTVTKFAEVLKAPLNYFFKENSEFDDFNYGFKILGVSTYIKKLKYREAEKLDEQTHDIVKREAFIKFSKLIELERIMNSEVKFKNPIRHLQNINTRAKAEQAALEVRKKWALYDNPFANVISVLEREGIKVIEVNASDSFEGLSATLFDYSIIVLNSAIEEVTRRRFTALHELGHIVLQIPETVSYGGVEKICDAFASMLILPKELLSQELGDHRTSLSVQELNLIKIKYGISVRAILVSALFAEIISNDQYHRLTEKVDNSGISKYRIDEHSVRFEQLLYRGVVEERIDERTFKKFSDGDKLFHELKQN